MLVRARCVGSLLIMLLVWRNVRGGRPEEIRCLGRGEENVPLIWVIYGPGTSRPGGEGRGGR